MKQYFGYIRVSTQRQGAQGVSLHEQKAAIEAYAQRAGLSVVAWYEERVTAAKRGRRIFAQMMKALSQEKADGVIIHKIDRSARNLRDWADLGELIDRGTDVHFVHDALDLRSRGGRLSADIQAVVAADYIRNLREETRKGFYGRLKQGLYPMRAPIGYRDMGRGKPKSIDPVQGPLVRTTFELYATSEWNFHTIQAEMTKRGLRNRNSAPVSLAGFTTILNSPFYMGLIHIRKTGELFEGVHPPLITKALYDRVQTVLRGRSTGAKPLNNDFLFRRMIRCRQCDKTLIGERQKERYVYYRCHSPGCKGTIVTEHALDAHFQDVFARLGLTQGDVRDLRDMIERLRGTNADTRDAEKQALQLQVSHCTQRLTRLTDALIDGLIDKLVFDGRHAALLEEKHGLKERLDDIDNAPSLAEILARDLELINTAQNAYKIGLSPEKRQIVESLTSNFSVLGKKPTITLKSPFQELLNLNDLACGDPHRDDTRTRQQKMIEILESAATKVANDNSKQLKMNETTREAESIPNVPDVPVGSRGADTGGH